MDNLKNKMSKKHILSKNFQEEEKDWENMITNRSMFK
jgi:hypothetical protein